MNHHAHGTSQPVGAPVAAPLDIPASEEMLGRLESRRSSPLRELLEPGPTAAELERMLRLAARVPDHGRLTPWRFVILAGAARRALGERLDALYARQNPGLPAAKADMWTLYLLRAPLTVILVSRPDAAAKVPEWNQVLSAGAAGMALTVAAAAMGFSTQWLLKWPGRDPQAAALIGVAAPERIAGFIHIGRPAASSEDRPRPVLDEVVHYWTPGQSMSNDTP
ncbi:nitroreductase [Ancylobacter dichloromethanicus]|uniref:Putative NAD(P)H nitroreductase n=1 Tax=Ancylobacter dichloromethanicus TaxID=518825 RepID=A0A9W6J913_9HYPH|nr:nitroreductase [Ancylobacter dichloromethanicus]MBS7554494.1 nitroreductase [Ancylobacter dichloromethanicus]GLK71624.1 nitroreductase [Ancylobacter dichloromethanicus]